MKFFTHMIFNVLLVFSYPLFGAQPKQEKAMNSQQKNSIVSKTPVIPEEIKQQNEKNAEEYTRLVAALGGKMLKANL